MDRASSRVVKSEERVWGAGPFDGDVARGFVRAQQQPLLDAVRAFLQQPAPVTFARAFAALELLVLQSSDARAPLAAEVSSWREPFLIAFDGVLSAHYEDVALLRAQRESVEARLAVLQQRPTEPAGERDVQALLTRHAEENRAEYTFPYEELLAWVEPLGNDAPRMWSACPRIDHMVALASVLGVSRSLLASWVSRVLEPSLARLPVDAPRGDAAALEQWATAVARGGDRGRMPYAQRARAAAHLLRAAEVSSRNHLGLAIKVLLDATAFEVGLAAERAGLSREAAMMDPEGPGWRAYHGKNRELAARLRELVPELPRAVADRPGLRRARS